MIWRCDLAAQYQEYQEEVDAAIKSVLVTGRYILDSHVSAFEKEFAAYLNGDSDAPLCAVGVNSGTDALVLALEAAGIGEGDEVITTPFTAIPTYSAIRRVKATPVFADIEEDTYLMDIQKVARAITPKTRAVVAVHLFGNAVDIPQLREVCGPNIFILEDCAQAHGAKLGDAYVGTLGDASAFSFYPTKNLGGYGDGGMVVTRSRSLADSVRSLRMYGMTSKDEFDREGTNSRLDELQAAILRVKLRYLDAMNDQRRQIAAAYASQLGPAITIQATRPNVSHVFHVLSACCGDRRDELQDYLSERGIQTNVYYPRPLTRQVGYETVFGPGPVMKVAERVCSRIIALPMYPELPWGTLSQVISAINEFFEGSYMNHAAAQGAAAR